MMALPGFTAERAEYVSRAAYRAAAGGGGGGLVVAQLRPIGFCMADCDMTATDPFSNAVCKIGCLDDGGGGGGGGGGPTCKPQCGPCVQGTRVCITANCDTVERTCRTVPPRRFSVLT